MNVSLRKSWTREQFLAWSGHQEGRYEFDGFQPVAMTGGTINHAILIQNLQAALRGRLHGSGCRPFGPDAGVATVGDAVRYPDGVITCSRVIGSSLTVPEPVVVFEVVSPSSGRIDRIVKVSEYAAVPSIRRYVIIESGTTGLTVFTRSESGQPWTAATLGENGILTIPEVGVEIPVSELYADVKFDGDEGGRVSS